MFAAYWPYDDEAAPHGRIATLFKNINKYVESRSGDVDTTWQGSVLLLHGGPRCQVSVDRRFVGDRKERARLPRERVVILEQRSVSGVRVRQQDSIGQVLYEALRVDDRDHLVMHTVDDKRGVLDRAEFREALPGDALPITERRHLCIGDCRS